jgi:ParB-like chromosome segregation protein Spo0J
VVLARTTDTGRLRPPRHPRTGGGRSHGSCFVPNQDARFEVRPTGLLVAPRRTARLHPKRQIERLARSIARFGFNAPIVVTGSDEIVAGEARWLAAKLLGRATVPVVIAEHLSPRQVEAYRIADNRLAEDAEWDEAILASIYRDLDLDLAPEDLNAIGFGDVEIDQLLAFGLPDPLANEDVAQVPAPPPVTRSGDLWQLGALTGCCAAIRRARRTFQRCSPAPSPT